MNIIFFTTLKVLEFPTVHVTIFLYELSVLITA